MLANEKELFIHVYTPEMPQQTSKSMTNYSDKSIIQIEISPKLINQQSNADKLLYESLKWQWELIPR